jgi:hypothetical protein
MSDQLVRDPEVIEPEDEYVDTFQFGGIREYTVSKNQVIRFKVMNEGDKAKYQRATNRDIKVDRRTQQASFRPDPVADRHALIQAAVTDWTLVTRQGGNWVPAVFNMTMLANWLEVADPAIVDGLEKAIRKANPWTDIEDATEEDILEQMKELEEQLVRVRAAEVGKG